MCIRDSLFAVREGAVYVESFEFRSDKPVAPTNADGKDGVCLLYTSDAADERSSVDLGGRRIIKKKKNKRVSAGRGYIRAQTICKTSIGPNKAKRHKRKYTN